MRRIKYLMLVGAAGVAAAGLSGCSWYHEREAKQTGRTTDMVAQDHELTGHVETALKHSAVYKFPDVSVRTYDRTVQLSGFVATDDQKRVAGDIAQQVAGVSRVINNIAVQPPIMTPTGRPAETNSPSNP